jgi:nicotinamidase-related amidase
MVSTAQDLCWSNFPLIVIDAVKGCCDTKYERPEWGLHFTKVREKLPQLNLFVERHRDNGGQVIWVKPTPWTIECLPSNVNKLYSENPNARFYVEDYIEEYDVFPDELKIESSDIIIRKNNYSAFVNPKLQELIDDYYLVSGFYADGCVNATIIEGWSKGYFPYILSDLVESMDPMIKQNQKTYLLTHMWSLMYGHIIDSKEIDY